MIDRGEPEQISRQPRQQPRAHAPDPPATARDGRIARILDLQRDAGNAAATAWLQRAPVANRAPYKPKSKTEGTAGGLSGLTLDVTFTVSGTPADGLQVVQTFMGTRRDDKVRVGTYTWKYQGSRWDAFVDGGKNSPYVTMTGEDPAHPTKPYYLTADEVSSQVTWDTDHGTVEIFDVPGAVALHDHAYFETAIIATNYNGTKRDKVLKVFTWGWTEKGTKPTVKKGTKIAGVDSGIKVRSTPSPEWKNIVKHDYPKYKYD